MKNEIVLYFEDSEVQRFKTLWDAYRGFKEIRRIDNELKTGIKVNEYNWQWEYEKDGILYLQPIKFYVRKGKMYYKYI